MAGTIKFQPLSKFDDYNKILFFLINETSHITHIAVNSDSQTFLCMINHLAIVKILR